MEIPPMFLDEMVKWSYMVTCPELTDTIREELHDNVCDQYNNYVDQNRKLLIIGLVLNDNTLNKEGKNLELKKHNIQRTDIILYNNNIEELLG